MKNAKNGENSLLGLHNGRLSPGDSRKKAYPVATFTGLYLIGGSKKNPAYTMFLISHLTSAGGFI